MALHRLLRLGVEDHHIPDQKAEFGTQQIAPLAQHRIQVLGAPFQPAVPDRGGEGHVAGMGGYVQMREQPRQVGIVGPVEDDEAGIHRNRLAVIINRHSAAVAADARRLFVNGDVMVGGEQEGAAQP